MGQVKTDAQAKSEPGAARPSPLSPHVQIWRWHITMAGSIAHRASGVALYGGALIAAGWALALALGPGAYATFAGLMGSWLGLLVMFGITLSIFYHLASGLRHLVWDTGRGLTPARDAGGTRSSRTTTCADCRRWHWRPHRRAGLVTRGFSRGDV